MTLTDRYIAATTHHLPADQRDEVKAELEASIADAVEAYVGDQDAAERAVLEDLGDPERLAATYANTTLALIGPRLYLPWKRLLTLLWWIVVPIVTVIAAVAAVADGKGFWAVVLAVWVSALTVTVHVGFWVTVIFAALDRRAPDDRLTEPWTIDQLPDAAQPHVSLGETVASATMLLLGIVVLVWQQVWPWASTSSGEGLPVIDPSLWSFTIPALVAVMAIELVTVIARHAHGQWAMKDWWATLALNAASLALLLPPLLGHTFLNRELFSVIGWPDANSPLTLDQTELIVAAFVVISAVSDVVPGWRKAHTARARAGAIPSV